MTDTGVAQNVLPLTQHKDVLDTWKGRVSTRTITTLRGLKVRTVEDLLAVTPAEVLRINDAGHRTVEEIKLLQKLVAAESKEQSAGKAHNVLLGLARANHSVGAEHMVVPTKLVLEALGEAP